ncbi:lipopolysaccharide assembly protein LapB [Niveibacterium sp. COAC-50]|uniref:tetratricopeptide repeat protein n=1 Tax=Niveibacterium sp. COAC-50 TaxID=2729384 RepID=UPI001553F607|nr:tetratricopeptide repeat protein [Niveibacterium sp. COAC-50]
MITTSDPARLDRLTGYLGVDPDNPHLLRDHANCALTLGYPEAALPSLARLCARDDAQADDFAAHISALRQTRQPEAARAAVASALARWPRHDWLRLEAALLNFAAGELEAALEHLPQVTDDAGLYPRIAETRIRLLHHLGRIDEALAIGEAMLADLPGATSVKAVLCPVLLDANRLDRAQMLAREVLAESGPLYDVLETLAGAALDAGDVEAAGPWLDQALAARQDDGRIWLLRGLTHMRAHDFARAEPAFAQAVALMPAHAGSHLARGWNLYAMGRTDDAMAAFEGAAAASPAFAEAYGSQAALFALTGRPERAQELLRKARLLDHQAASVQYVAALLRDAKPEDIALLAEQVIVRARNPNPK